MPQGFNQKKKGPSKPQAMKKGQRQAPIKNKRGRLNIAPKKAKAIEAKLVQKKLKKAINATIELEVQAKASKEPQPFKLLKKIEPEDKKK